jgi:coenzyme PQQ synthesis protein D (PqqD)
MSERYIARSGAIAARMLGAEMMVMSATDSTFFTLNEVATVIWESADGTTPLSRIVTEKVCSEFEVDAQSAERDATEFVDELAKHGILVVSEHPITTSASGDQTTP